MADHTHIEWTDATWNVVTGCSVVSPGCTNCYAMRLAGTRLRHHPSRAGLTVEAKAGQASSSAKRDRPAKHVWNGQVRFNEAWLTQPLRWRRPRRIFVAAHGDLFHEGVTDAQLDRIFAVMALCPQHTFQVLTKRPGRMRAYLTDQGGDGAYVDFRIGEHFRRLGADFNRDHFGYRLPLPNVWLGVSVEDQNRANQRVPELMATPAAVRWISAEPLLGAVDLNRIWVRRLGGGESLWDCLREFGGQRIDWVVAGGESGPGARPMHPAWARQLRDQCAAAGVPFLFKQWGDYAAQQPVYWADDPVAADRYVKATYGPDEKAEDWDLSAADCVDYMKDFPDVGVLYRDGYFYDGVEFQPTPGKAAGCWWMERVGKRTAGRLLDGRLHDAYPEARS